MFSCSRSIDIKFSSISSLWCLLKFIAVVTSQSSKRVGVVRTFSSWYPVCTKNQTYWTYKYAGGIATIKTINYQDTVDRTLASTDEFNERTVALLMPDTIVMAWLQYRLLSTMHEAWE